MVSHVPCCGIVQELESKFLHLGYTLATLLGVAHKEIPGKWSNDSFRTSSKMNTVGNSYF